jgi:hypothetical protein
VSENGELRRIFGPKREKVTGEWRKLRNEELYKYYYDVSNQVGCDGRGM